MGCEAQPSQQAAAWICGATVKIPKSEQKKGLLRYSEGAMG